jgi:DNA-binding NtrC family response regulator
VKGRRIEMASERTICEQRKSSSPSSAEEKSPDFSVTKEQIVEFFNIKENRGKAGEDIFHSHSSGDDFSLGEEKFRLNIIKLFIEYFCIKKRVPFKELISSLERMIIIRALSQFNGNQRKTAQFLGMKYTTLNEKVKRYNIRIQNRAF